MTGQEPLRADVLITELRAFEHSHRVQSRGGRRPDHVEMADRYARYADALEAATGGQHIEAKYYAEIGRLRARVAELEAEARDLMHEEGEQYRHLSRLHEIATERTVQLEAELEATKKENLRVRLSALEAVIRRARKAPPVETFEGGIRQDSVYTILNSVTTETST